MSLPSCKGWRHVETQEKLNRCQILVALHEFGHAAGLAHEHKRPDSTCKIKNDGPEDGLTPVGNFDKDSVMNYCPPSVGNFFVQLSPGDIQAINSLYP
jgi:hypothetical protein